MRPIKNFALLFAGIFLLVSCRNASAQDTAGIIELGGVIVTASRTEQEIKETPAAVEVITREDIVRLGAQNLGDALRLATGIDIGAPAVDVGAPEMAGRGISVRGMSTRHVLILVDGKRQVTEGSYLTANSNELNRINMNNVERVEIVRGPVSSLYGSEGMGGVINIITRKPKKQEVTLSFDPWRYSRQGGHGGEDFFFRYDGGKKDRFGWLVSYNRSQVSAFDNDDRGTGFHDTANNQYGYRDMFGFESTYDLTPGMRLDFSASHERDRLKGRTGVRQFERYGNERTQFSLGLRGDTESSSYQIRVYYGKHDKDAPVYAYEGGPVIDFDVSKREAWVLEGHVSRQSGERHIVTFGGEYRAENYWGTRVGNAGTAGSAVYGGMSKAAGDFDIGSYAFYVQDEWLVSDKLLIIPSLRYDDSDRFSGNFSPKLGATYKLSDNYRVKANIGKSFKAPTLDDMFMKMTKRMGPYVVTVNGNPNLKPEESTSYELSIEGENGRTSGKLTYFMNDVDNLITAKTVRTGMQFTSTYYNEDRADINGVELELGRRLSNHFTLKANYTWLDATGTDGGRLTGRAKHRGTLQLHYDENLAYGISAVLWLDWNKNYLSSTAGDLDFCTLNLALSKKVNETLRWFAGADNIFNKKEADLSIYGTIIRAGVTITL